MTSERGKRREREDDEPGAERIVLQLVDPLLILRILLGVRLLLGDDLREPATVLDAHARGRRERGAWVEGPKLDELLRPARRAHAAARVALPA